MTTIKKIICKIFGHPNRKHFHEKNDVIICNGGCEKYEDVDYVFPCPRCGSKK